MARRLAWIAACGVIMPSGVLAQEATVTGGLHDGFSRLVVDFDNRVTWQLGRAQGGYQLRASDEGVTFDLSRAFEKLPPEHVLNIRVGEQNDLFIDIGCTCFADAFELEAGLLVLDIVEGAPPADAQFEQVLSPEDADQQSNVIALALQEATQLVDVVTQSSGGAQVDLGTLFPEPDTLELDQSLSVATENIADVALPQDMDAPPINPVDETRNVARQTTAEPPEPAEQVAQDGDETPLFPSLGSSGSTTGSSIFSNAQALGVPDIPLVDVTSAEQERISSARTNLLQQLQRAVSQGFVEFPTDSVQLGAEEEQEPAKDEKPKTRPESAFDRREHVFIETAADRDALEPVVRALKVNSARDCLPPEWFDVGSWHGDFPDTPSLEGLRASLVGEFDKVNGAAAIALSERYIYMGFGAEARAIMREFGIDSAHSEILSALGATVDLRFETQSEMFLRQQVCESPAALWAIVADPAFRANPDVNTKVILKNFSDLPVHLRNHIGPILAQRFIAADDPATSTTIRNIIDRSSFGDQTAIALIDAHVELDRDDTVAASPLLETVVAQDGPEAAEALAELIENRFAEGLPIDGKLAQSADALAVEYRGTPTGARLVKASIRAFSVAGEPSTTFDRIFDALENGSISEEEARVLRAEAHLGSAQYSNDVDFLRYAFLFPFEADLIDGPERRARRDVARRLSGLGLLDRALATLPSDPINWNEEDRVIAAGISIQKDRPLEALGYVRGMENEEAKILAARALQAAGQLEAAAKSYADVGMTQNAQDMLWRAGDWPTLMQTDDSTLAQAAHLAAGQPITDPDGAEQPTELTALELPSNSPLAQSREMIKTSQLAREILGNLLASSQSSQP